MPTETLTATASASDVEQKVREMREAFADAPEAGRIALENLLKDLKSELASRTGARTESAGRIGSRNGNVSELTMIAPFAPGGAKRLRTVLEHAGRQLPGRRKGRHGP